MKKSDLSQWCAECVDDLATLFSPRNRPWLGLCYGLIALLVGILIFPR